MAIATKEHWFERSFAFDTPLARWPCILDRLRGAPARAEEKTRGVSSSRLTHRFGNTWSAQENIGHLADLEALWSARLDDFLAGAPMLRPADLDNKATWNAGHNNHPIAPVLDGFRAARAGFLSRLEGLDPAELELASLHPRLKQPMRIIDHAFFVAEHDDYHLARIHELLAMKLS